MRKYVYRDVEKEETVPSASRSLWLCKLQFRIVSGDNPIERTFAGQCLSFATSLYKRCVHKIAMRIRC